MRWREWNYLRSSEVILSVSLPASHLLSSTLISSHLIPTLIYSSHLTVGAEGEKHDTYHIVEVGTLVNSFRGMQHSMMVNQGSFGLYSLMANMPLEFTVSTVTPVTIWQLKRNAFQYILILKKKAQLGEAMDFVVNVPILSKF